MSQAATLTAKGQRCDFEVETFIAHALRADGFDASDDGTGRGTPLALASIAFAQNTRDEVRIQGGDGQISGSLAANPGMKQTTYVAQAFDMRGRDGGAQFEGPHETANLRAASGGSSRSYVCTGQSWWDDAGDRAAMIRAQDSVTKADTLLASRWAVRRLTPTECERLQGVPDDYTRIAWRGKPASECPDGPRYKALGNSWAVPVVAWIARRITDTLRTA